LLRDEDIRLPCLVEVFTDRRLQPVFDAAPESLAEIHMLASNLYLHERSPLLFETSKYGAELREMRIDFPNLSQA
jgi:hypothetical protein